MITVTVQLEFCAAHRLVNYDGPCAHPHGHNYRVEIEVQGPLDERGFVADFGVVKAAYKTWVDAHWDHAFVLYDRDPVIVPLYAPGGPLADMRHWCALWNPTAEHMAQHLRLLFPALVQVPGLVCAGVTVWEKIGRAHV